MELGHLGSRLLFLLINYHPTCEAAVNSQTTLALYVSYLYTHKDAALKRSAWTSHISSGWRGRWLRSSAGPIASQHQDAGLWALQTPQKPRHAPFTWRSEGPASLICTSWPLMGPTPTCASS
ncbi:hypothetical protein GH733_008778 [Mirounga leonina]|nr:hypothetical protein GH733_008778 [Mirounga leonina]